MRRHKVVPPGRLLARKDSQALLARRELNSKASGSSKLGVLNFLRRSKDASVGFAGRFAINRKLRGIGDMTELAIDTKNKSVRVRLELIGESAPIEIEIARYRLNHTPAGSFLIVEDATASREWLDVALREFVIGQSFPIPEKAEALLKLLA